MKHLIEKRIAENEEYLLKFPQAKTGWLGGYDQRIYEENIWLKKMLDKINGSSEKFVVTLDETGDGC